nr:unnamed protein product [Callosobruchus analis]
MYQVRKGDSFYVGLKCLEIMWMMKPDHREEGPPVYIFRMALALSLIIFFQIGPTLHIVMVASTNHHRCNTIFKKLVDHQKFGKPRTFDAMKTRCRMLALFLLLYCPVGVLVYGALISYDNRNSVCVRLQKETDQNLYCSLLYPLWFPVAISRHIIFTIQTAASIGLYTPGGQVCVRDSSTNT